MDDRRRRRVPRMATSGWLGTYTDDDAAHECRVIDISVLGLGLELLGDVPGDLIGHRLTIEVHAPVGDSVTLRLMGRVRNMSPGAEGSVRAGLEFVGLSETERAILSTMELMKVAW
jgi:hypothetical protein